MIDERNESLTETSMIQSSGSRTDESLTHIIRLLVQVIPVGQIFCCSGNGPTIRLIMVLDQFRYQEHHQTEKLLGLFTLTQPMEALICFTYATMNDYLLRGHIFYTPQCLSSQCIYLHERAIALPETKMHNYAKLMENARLQFDKGRLKCLDLLDHVQLLLNNEKHNMAAFILHQCCEHLFRFIIFLFKTRDLKNHQLILLRQQAGFYYPEVNCLFDERERKELKWLKLLQTAYIGARYDNYAMPLADLLFQKDRLDRFLSRMELHRLIFI